jgi:acetyltransferase-like isoleucine patch superfamily enzyme
VSVSLKLNLIKTIYFNFKVLPFKQAVKLPIHFYGRTELANISGLFSIESKDIRFGMIVFGGKHEVVISSNVATRIYNTGHMIFYGKTLFARGVNVMVWNNAVLSFGNNFSIGSLSRIICFRQITFGDQVLISWECQFFDSDFHFIINDNKSIKDNCGTTTIGDGVWIGTRSTILKNTTIDDDSIVAANSLCSGNYRDKFGSGVLLAGIPAKMIRGNLSYLKDKRKEMELFAYFSKHQNQEIDWTL